MLLVAVAVLVFLLWLGVTGLFICLCRAAKEGDAALPRPVGADLPRPTGNELPGLTGDERPSRGGDDEPFQPRARPAAGAAVVPLVLQRNKRLGVS